MLGPLEDWLPRSLRTRAATLSGDARMIASRLRGERPPPFHARASAAGHGAAIALRRVAVVEVAPETEDAVRLVLEDAAGRTFEHQPGQFLTLLVPVDGVIARRAYSIAWCSDDGRRVAVGVKRVGGGRVSPRLCEAKPGDRLDALGPSGAFVQGAEDGTVTVLVGGGSGITPLLRLATARLAHREDARVVVVLGNRSWKDVMFRADLAALAAMHGERFVLVHVLDQVMEGADAGLALRGPIDAAVLASVLDRVPFPLEAATWFLCGPGGMMDVARAAIAARGVAPASIREERFVTVERAPAATAAQRVTFRLPGGAAREVLARPGATLLEAGLEAGVALPYSCTMGGCGACKVRVSGPTAMADPSCLSEDERAAGDVLACVASACGHVTVEVPAS